ncbi:hypothetical protein [Usitatibacter palustris]|uniref:Uncharacterized protein n=1 Tax=Usitatibacter palustris TaxID=2732487 RepID=A0A6M4HB90_9PROT|nr:hypothetical protein [Usitatibacter palustris]QJR16856.1 hypothetical protein DSM104440_03692 [Usitatibacter palustris]
MIRRYWRAAIAGVALACMTASAQVPESAARRYAVASLIGNEILVVGSRASTLGTKVDRNDRQVMPINDEVLDKSVLLSVDAAMKAAQPGSAPILLDIRDARLFSLQERALDDPKAMRELLEAVKPVADRRGATHLILVTKHRDQALMQFGNAAIGQGKVEGLGFYLDRSARTYAADGARGRGFFGSFAYIKVTLFELATMKVVLEEVAKKSRAVTAGRGRGVVDPWSALSAHEKVDELRWLIDEAMKQAVPKVVAAH